MTDDWSQRPVGAVEVPMADAIPYGEPRETIRQMEDLEFLRCSSRPDYESADDPLIIVDLFCGCGGLTLGLAEAARASGRSTSVGLAIDSNKEALEVFRCNFPKANVQEGLVETYFDGSVGAPTFTEIEEQTKQNVGELHCLAGGPPCQGNSDLNNRTRRDDPRNALYERMARAAEVLLPPAIIIENVPAVRHDRAKVVEHVRSALTRIGYGVADDVLPLANLGVAQKRKRHILLAILEDEKLAGDILRELQARRRHEGRTVRWAIEDLESQSNGAFDSSAIASKVNATRIRWLFENDEYELPNELRPECHWGDHSYRSMYGRLRYDEAAPTITTGFGSMGQGRYVHPTQARTITPHEAARLQFFPDFFDFSGTSRRGAWAEMIGNAVPPKLSLELGACLMDAGVV